MENLDLSRQALMIPQDITNWGIKVFGVGSVGSHLVKTLAKTGFINIDVYDGDTVESENIAAQAYDFRHIGMNKVDAIKEIVKESAGVDITAHHGIVTTDTEINPEPNTVYVCVFDSLEARKMVFGKVKEYPVPFVDGRIGQLNMRHYLVDCSNKEQVDIYSESLDTDAVSELACGEKACAPVNSIIAGKIAMNIISYITGKSYEKTYIGNAGAPKNQIVVLEKRGEEDGISSLH